MIIHDRSVCDYIIAMAEFIAKPATFRSIVLLHANDYFSDEVKVIFRPGLEGVSIRWIQKTYRLSSYARPRTTSDHAFASMSWAGLLGSIETSPEL